MPEIIRILLGLLRKEEKRGVVRIIVLMIISALLESLSVSMIIPLAMSIVSTREQGGIIGVILKEIGLDGSANHVPMLLIGLILLFIGKNLFMVWEKRRQFYFTTRVYRRIHKDVVHYYMTRPYSFFLQSDSGKIIRTINNDTNQAYNLMNDVLTFCTEGVIFVIMTLFMLIINPAMTLFVGAVLLLEYVIIMKLLRPYLRRMGESYRKESAMANHWILQMIRGIKSIRVTDTEPFFEKKNAEHVDRMLLVERKEHSLRDVPRALIESVTISAMLIYLLIYYLGGNDLTELVPLLSAMALATVRLLPSVNRFSSAATSAAYRKSSLKSVSEICEKTGKLPAETLSETDSSLQVSKPGFQREIRMEDICFAYEDGKKPILNHADFRVCKGQSVGIIGTSGAGKTTSVDILLGLLKPLSGRILIDDWDVSENPKAWLSLIAYIPQEVFILNGTIRDNVAFGQDPDQQDDKKIWEALEDAQLADHVRGLPDGLNTYIGEAGVRFSGGQRQRLGIARALYRDPQILILDEATSSLDQETEAELMAAIHQLKKKKTLIMITHRLNTVSQCDEIYQMEDGKLVLQTTRQE